MPMVPEAVIAMLACARTRALFTRSCLVAFASLMNWLHVLMMRNAESDTVSASCGIEVNRSHRV